MPSLSTHTPTYKFLLDENVRRGLYKFLKQRGVDVKLAVKGSSDQALQHISKQENRVLVTNDEDFSMCSKDEVYSVVWLRIPQNDEEGLLQSFEMMTQEVKSFASKLIVLYPDKWEEYPLVIKIEV